MADDLPPQGANPVIVAEKPLEIGGHQALSYLPDGYEGRCALFENDFSFAVLPNQREAKRVASYAIGPDGGYSGVEIHPTSAPCTDSSFEEWLDR